MNPSARKLPWTVGIGLLLAVLSLALAFLVIKVEARAAHRDELPVYGSIGDFSLTNQNGARVSLADLRGRVWIADIIFTRCPGPCLRMTQQMKEVQDASTKDSPLKLVSLTTDPEYDTPAILKTYGERHGEDPGRWTFLTGTKPQIANLAVDSLRLSAVETKPEERASADDLFVHSTIFVIIDKHAQLRGIYQTGGEDVSWPAEKQRLLAAAKQLEREE